MLLNYLRSEPIQDAGLPAGVLNIVQHSRDDAEVVVDALISDNRIRKVNFTGSTAVGRIIAAKAAQYGKPALLELGGKCPLIVLKDADLDKAAQAAAFGAFEHHGQICMSTERIIVDETVVNDFAAKLFDIVKKTTVHPGASPSNVSKVASLVSDALSQDMKIWGMETFGPVAVLVAFKSVKEAIELANDSEYGLSASIFTADIAKAIAIAKLLDSGAVHINSTTVHDEAHMPHGGTKASGWGRFGVPWGFAEFTQIKTISIPTYDADEFQLVKKI
ncbi:putative salicylaldehyde dehydrogenase protein [Phaeoacremonium minimum UCRPA7]|uniref:Putative salicylaldehyde dehydrogenase protein n=1 Tax=Phaeoacremonium minimum (strain UCR-PA7) TaxID=1286976 RepID=R8BP77_PHAM7|nr:putative salicylaldehyde dehydrogenase protein [Phaeoacremonium minimum UCRPA7]EOO01142.1 putative salicylaldehyde dehydrogenase protein [Phaeoacremonium minimum UCRPA7]